MILDSETKAVELPDDHGNELRLWLRLLTCTTLIEGEVRSRLRERFDVTLPRFDLMAQLDKVPEGMTLSDVSKRMMVSNGNVTGLVERLVESGHLDRRTSETDRRVQVIRLTKVGRAEFRKMAAEHENWIADIFSDLAPKDVRELMRLLAKTKASAQKSAQDSGRCSAVSAGIDYEVEYNNRARVPENPALMAGWATGRRRLSRSSTRRARIRLRSGRAPHASISFRRRSAKARSSSSFTAATGRRWTARRSAISPRGLNAHGIGVAIPSYDLCPEVTVDRHHRADADGDARTGAASGGRLSSAAIPPAGISRPACWRPTGRRSMRRCRRISSMAAYAISGLFELGPLVEPPSTRRCVSTRPPRGPQARCSGRRRRMAASMRWWARTKARNITGKAEASSTSGARPALRRGSARFPPPITSPRLRRWPIRLRRWCRDPAADWRGARCARIFNKTG